MKNKNFKNTTKAELKTVLEGYADVVTDKSLKDRIAYTLKKYSECTKKVVLDLVSDIEVALTRAEAQPMPVENSTKPKPKLSKKGKGKTESKPVETADEETVTPEPEKTEEKPKSKTTKSKAKKPTLKKPKATTGATEKSVPMAAIFPEKIEDENIGTLVAVPDKYHSIKELREAVESGEKTLVVCAYYPLPLVKKYGYASTPECNARVPKNGFNHDLDIQQVIYACEGIDRVYALSDYTEAMFFYDEGMLEPLETKDNATGETVKTRFACGCEFEIYELVEEAE